VLSVGHQAVVHGNRRIEPLSLWAVLIEVSRRVSLPPQDVSLSRLF